MLEAFQRWIKRFGARPWHDELQKAFEAGYRAGMKHDERAAIKPRSPNYARIDAGPPNKSKIRIMPKPKSDPLLERLHSVREIMNKISNR